MKNAEYRIQVDLYRPTCILLPKHKAKFKPPKYMKHNNQLQSQYLQ